MLSLVFSCYKQCCVFLYMPMGFMCKCGTVGHRMCISSLGNAKVFSKVILAIYSLTSITNK